MEIWEDGFPEWTELGQDSGLDPLGMQRPIEAIYQALIPGISTITLRYRYYSFFALILKYYEDNIRHNDPEEFRFFQRRCEALFALICCYGATELGITGSDWATKTLNEIGAYSAPERIIEFSIGADQNADATLRYLKNKGGAFGAIYSTQMSEMGLVHFPEQGQPNPNPVCSDTALKLAETIALELDGKASDFFQIVEAGSVSGEALGALEAMKPSMLKSGSDEHRMLMDILLAKAGAPSEADIMRRNTLLMLLEFVGTLRFVPRAEQVKWQWFENDPEQSPIFGQQAPQLWFLYQACDLMRLSYETILYGALTLLEAAPRGRMSLAELTDEIAEFAEIPAEESWEDFSSRVNDGAKISEARVQTLAMLEALGAGEVADQIRHAISLIAILDRLSADHTGLMAKALSGADHFQSLRTEMQYLERNRTRNAGELVSDVIRERVLKRHLWVASRKFRNQKAYTFLMEPEEGLLRYRSHFRVSPSSPRLDQALRFLRDIHLVGDEGITEIGKSELVVA